MRFTSWSIRNPAPSVLLFIILSLAGIYCFHAAVVKNMPDFQSYTFTVALSLPGASPEQLESQVAIPVENAFASLKRLRSIRTVISDGNVLLELHFSHKRSIIRILFDIRAALTQVRPYLPKDLQRARIHHESASVGNASAVYSITSSKLSRGALTWFTANTVYRALGGIPELRKFEILGGVSRDVEVTLSPAKITALGLTVPQVSAALKSTEQDRSGGEAHIGGLNQGIRTVNTVRTLSALRNLSLAFPNGNHILLGQVATIKAGHADRASVAMFDGKRAVGFEVFVHMDSDELRLIKHVNEVVSALQRKYPAVHFTQVISERGDILSEYYQSIRMLIEGAILAILVILLFLRSARSTLIGAIALPLSILPTFIFIYVVGWSLNTMTLLALLVVTGILVDDAIVEIENIHRHLLPGISLREATISAVNDIGLSVIATALALVLVFLPTSFMHGFSGEIFKEFGFTACVAVLASLLVARLITPVLAVWLLEKAPPEHAESKIAHLYAKAVQWSVRHKAVVSCATVLIIAGSVYLYTILPTGYIPPSEEDYTTVNIALAPGATVPEALQAAAEVRKAILKPYPVIGVAHIFTRVGDSPWNTNGGPGILTDVRKVKMTVSFTARAHRPSEAAIESAIRKRVRGLPGMQISVNGSSFGERLSITLAGANPEQLNRVAGAVERQMHSIHGLTGISSAMGLAQTDVLIRPKRAVAAALGVTTAEIARTVRIATGGAYTPELAKLNLGERRLNIRVRLPRRYAHSLSALGSLRIATRGGLVPLSALAHLSLQNVPLTIRRYNRERFLKISADLDGMPLGEAFKKVGALSAMQHLPRGVQWIKMGVNRLMAELFEDFGGELGMAALLVYALLVLLFKDPFQPITVICAAPLCLGGALVGVWLSGSSINLPVFLGFVLLLGLATKNSILLVDYAQKAIAKRALPAQEAITEACRVRARPILMTTMAMVAGMIPLLISIGGEDVSFSSPLAATVIGGLLGSTLLSLFVVPVVFLLVERIKTIFYRLLGASAVVRRV